MADLHILREHRLGFAAARKIAFQWAEQAEQDFDMECTYIEGDGLDEVVFKRTGVSGLLQVSASTFELSAKLGFLLGAFKDKIEAEIVKNLDQLLKPQATATTTVKPTAKATTTATAQATTKPTAKAGTKKK